MEDGLPQEAPEPASPADSVVERVFCQACKDDFSSDEVVLLNCGDCYCFDCLIQLFTTAIKDETYFPAQCCGVVIDLKRYGKFLPKSLVKEFKEKRLELRTKDRTYCWRVECTTFIAPHSTHNGQAICQRCRAVTCCKSNNWRKARL